MDGYEFVSGSIMTTQEMLLVLVKNIKEPTSKKRVKKVDHSKNSSKDNKQETKTDPNKKGFSGLNTTVLKELDPDWLIKLEKQWQKQIKRVLG